MYDVHGRGGLCGKLLVSSPRMDDDFFKRSVILILAHDRRAAMGVVINRVTQALDLRDLCKELSIPVTENIPHAQVHCGGPVSLGTGIVVHSAGYHNKATIPITDHYRVTACLDVLKDFEKGVGPQKSIFVLGYAVWGPGQLEAELKNGDWIVSDPTEDLLFGDSPLFVWDLALKKSGFGRFAYTPVVGNA